MLEEIDDIDWSVLEHAYGPAKDVPDAIRALASPDAEEREKALHRLYGNIFHQGTRYEATAYAVPFLLKLAADPATLGRPELVRLLARLAIGYDEQWLPDTFAVERWRADAVGGEELLRAAPPVVDEWADTNVDDDADEDEDDGDGDEDRYWYYESLSDEDANALYAHVVLATYDAVRRGVPLLRSLVAADDPVLRRAAAYALAWFPEEAAGSVAALAPATVAESDDPESVTAAASALVALGVLGRGATDAGGHVDVDGLAATATSALADERELLRWGGAVALAALRGPGAGGEVVAELLSWAGGPPEPRDDVPFLRGDVGGLAALALRHLGDAHADAVFDALLGRLRAVSDMPAATVLYEALRQAWPGGEPVAEGTPFARLTAPQQRLLRVVAESPDAWHNVDFRLLLSGRGLPRDIDEMRAYVGSS